jgi:predicted ABC-type ATPase
MFAGPNGSGKSTLKTVLRPELLGVYLNPDEMEHDMRKDGFLDLSAYGVTISDSEAKAFFSGSTFLARTGLGDVAARVRASGGRLHFDGVAVNSYVASVTADLFRRRLLDERVTFTLETVMSHSSKVELLEHAQLLGYRTYLYFIATEDPEINISRVKTRVGRGGHAVPEDRIVKRYHASLNLLIDAIRHTNRAYIFDNSGEGQEKTWLAEVTEGRELEMKADQMPAWFKNAVWDRIVGDSP